METENKKPSNPRMTNLDGMYAAEARAEDFFSLRDYFANSAMQGILSNPNWMKEYKNEKYLMQSDIASKVAYDYADAMLKQREI